MATASQKRDSYGSQSIVMDDLRHRQEMDQSNRDFLAALERYFQTRKAA